MNREEEMALRELAAGRCAIQKVIDVLGPMSLWSKTELEKEILKAVAAEREACAKVAEEPYEFTSEEAHRIASAIRARGEQ
jgi:CHASE3 domain sensor protein